eukprot:Hpha_TRINITY_DN15092_c0_g8::TRINITY_DN15092_c0_g8_i1::g.124508::m.124508
MPAKKAGAMKKIQQNGPRPAAKPKPQARTEAIDVGESKKALKRQRNAAEKERMVKRLRVAEASKKKCEEQIQENVLKIREKQELAAGTRTRTAETRVNQEKKKLELAVAKLHSDHAAADARVKSLSAQYARLNQKVKEDGEEEVKPCRTEDLLEMSRAETLAEPSALLRLLGRLLFWARRKRIRSTMNTKTPNVEYDYYVTIRLPEAATDEENAEHWLERTFQRSLDEVLFGDDNNDDTARSVAPRVRSLRPHPSGAGLVGTLSLTAVPWDMCRGRALGTPEDKAMQAGEILLRRAVTEGGAVQRRYRVVEVSEARVVRRQVCSLMGLGGNQNIVQQGVLQDVAEWAVGEERDFAKGTQKSLLATPSGQQTLARIRLLVERCATFDPPFLTMHMHRDGVRELLMIRTAGFAAAESSLKAGLNSLKRKRE